MNFLYIILSVLPYYESRYTVPIVVAQGGTLIDVVVLSFINSLVFPIVTIILDKFKKYIEKIKLVKSIIDRTKKKKDLIEKYGYFGLYIFVLIPVPGSGVYSGSILSWFLNLNRKKAYVTITAAVLTLNIIIYIMIKGILDTVT